MMTKKQRVEAVLAGQKPDRPPASCWYHFPPEEATGQAAVDAHLKHLETYDLDFLKVMNDHEFPRMAVEVVHSVDDLKKIKPLAGDTGELGGQLEVLRKLKAALGNDILTCTTVFNPWTLLRKLVAPLNRHHGPPTLQAWDQRDQAISALLKEDRAAVKAALDAITETLADFSARCIEAGADGIFLSVRDDWVDNKENGPNTYAEIVRPTDMKILDAVQGAPFNFLHICGKPLDFMDFAQYPVKVVNWADRAAGPSIAYARERVEPTIAGGVDNLNTLPNGTPDEVAAEVRDALRQAKDRPIMIAPGCTFDPNVVPSENLKAMFAAVRA